MTMGTVGDVGLTVDEIRAVADLLHAAVRTPADWIGRIPESSTAMFAIVLPDVGIGAATGIKQRLIDVLDGWQVTSGRQVEFNFGVAVWPGYGSARKVHGNDLISLAEKCRACPGRPSTQQRIAIQESVAAGGALACRQAEVLEARCTLKRVRE